MKPQVIQAFAGDSISLQVAVFDDRDQMFDLAERKIETARFEVPKLGIAVDGEMAGNVARFLVEADKTDAGNYAYFVVLVGSGVKFTVAYGTLRVMRLPE